ncbi:hypothetical protein FB45DRAFT_1019105 [Roridomyces roridus]|uniref:Uncharacterized protein n=1 Tax=Roridomyces roridus TaxID=1738132 RepID=A0AAD7CG49_9AGAR|nr:hypothetical protein FB45DRAFT_1019105 [Roridomyces roridus]
MPPPMNTDSPVSSSSLLTGLASWFISRGGYRRFQLLDDQEVSKIRPGSDSPGKGRRNNDDVRPAFSIVADAIRIPDGSRVLIKKSEPERAYLGTFGSDPLASEPGNRCIRLIEILSVPDDPRFDLIVMPFY